MPPATPSPSTSVSPVWGHELRRTRRFLALLAPQTVAGIVLAITIAAVLKQPPATVALHALLVAAVFGAFFLGCGILATVPRLGASRALAHLGALFAFALWLAINPLYPGNFLTRFFWGGSLAPDSIRTIGPHLAGFRAAFGLAVYWVAGALALLAIGWGLWLQWRAAARWERLRRVFARDAGGRSSPLLGPGLATLFLAAAACAWLQAQPRAVLRDPVFSFWLRPEKSSAQNEVSLADQVARARYPRVAEFRRATVLVFVVDCLRADHLPLHGYTRDTAPFLRSLAEAGRLQRVELGLAVGNNSPQGIFALLGSRHVETQVAGNFNLAEALHVQGYRTHLIGAGDHTSFEQMRRSYGGAWDVFVDGFQTQHHSINDDRLILETLDRLRPSDGTPAFFQFHLMSVHTLSVRNDDFARWRPAVVGLGTGFNWSAFLPGGRERQFATNTYDNGILQADDVIRRILATLEAKGYLKDYVAVITGDHGEGLGEHGSFGHTRFLLQEDVHVPMLWLDSRPGAPVTPIPFADQTDIAPTLLARLGLPAPLSWEGAPLGVGDPRAIAWLSGSRENPWRGLVRRAPGGALDKYLFQASGTDRASELLFDLCADPGENHNRIATASPALLGELRALASTHFHATLPPL